MNVKIGVMGIVGAIVCIFTLAAFFLISFERQTIHLWALVFILLSEFVFFGAMVGIPFLKGKHSTVFLRTGLGTALFLYFMITVVCAIIFAWLVGVSVNHFVLINCAIIALFGIISVLIMAFSRRNAVVDERSRAAVEETTAKRGGF